MDKQDIAEQAYKNGYRQALKDFAERVRNIIANEFSIPIIVEERVVNEVNEAYEDLTEVNNAKDGN